MDELPSPLLRTVEAKYQAALRGRVEPEEVMVGVGERPTAHGVVEVAVSELIRGAKGSAQDYNEDYVIKSRDRKGEKRIATSEQKVLSYTKTRSSQMNRPVKYLAFISKFVSDAPLYLCILWLAMPKLIFTIKFE